MKSPPSPSCSRFAYTFIHWWSVCTKCNPGEEASTVPILTLSAVSCADSLYTGSQFVPGMAVPWAWQSHGHGSPMAWQSHGHGSPMAWQSHGHGSPMGMAVPWHGSPMGMAVPWAWQSHGHGSPMGMAVPWAWQSHANSVCQPC